jgi:hypothetical protein
VSEFLSEEWFAAVAAAGKPGPDAGPAIMVLEQAVHGGPHGAVEYRVEIGEGWARIVWPVPEDGPPADLRISSEWATAVAIAKGELSAQRALMEGRLRIKGDPGRLAVGPGLDPVPAPVRAATTY